MRPALQNRVNPAGEIVAVAARGDFMGNRGGAFHGPDGRLAGAARWRSRRWIVCLTAFRGRRRRVWGDSYTELFFMDEPTALAAGHRPCFECRRAAARSFAAGLGGSMSADGIDARLHVERLDGARKRLHEVWVDDLPDAAMIYLGGRFFALRGESLLPWSFDGYGAPAARPRGLRVECLTPPTTLAALRAGYAPRWRESGLNSSSSPPPAG